MPIGRRAGESRHREQDPPGLPLSVVYIIGTYPSLTTTFIDRELTALRRLGVQVQVLSIRRPSTPLSAAQEREQQSVIYLFPVALLAFLVGHLRYALLGPRAYFGTLLYLLFSHHPDRQSRLKTLLHFAEGVYAAEVLRGHRFDHLHVHFIDRAATVALIVSRLRDVPYSVTAHAYDIYVNPLILPEKVAQAKFVATVSNYNVKNLDRLCDGRAVDKLRCIYLGIDLENYDAGERTPTDEPIVLSVGRLTEKKGMVLLVRACQILRDRGRSFSCVIVGDGELRGALDAEVRKLALAGVVELVGALPHPEVIDLYRRAQIFALPCIVGDDGDRDGTPTVLLEAMAMQLPVISTRVSGIPEVVQDGVNGLLVPPGDVAALADALDHLLADRELQRLFGRRGREIVVADFDAERNVRRLLAEFIAPTGNAVSCLMADQRTAG